MTKVPATEHPAQSAGRRNEAAPKSIAIAVENLPPEAIEALETARMNSRHDQLNHLMHPTVPE